jgi:hypothetical protein
MVTLTNTTRTSKTRNLRQELAEQGSHEPNSLQDLVLGALFDREKGQEIAISCLQTNYDVHVSGVKAENGKLWAKVDGIWGYVGEIPKLTHFGIQTYETQVIF